MGYFCTKIRNQFNDEALDAMVFMRQYLKNQRKEKMRSSQNSQNIIHKIFIFDFKAKRLSFE